MVAGLEVVTFGPIASTTPAPSEPMTSGSGIGIARYGDTCRRSLSRRRYSAPDLPRPRLTDRDFFPAELVDAAVLVNANRVKALKAEDLI